MTRRSKLWLAAATLLVGGASPGLGQDANRSWTDPPVSVAPADETVTYPEAPKAGARPAAQADPEAAPTAAAEPQVAVAPPRTAQGAPPDGHRHAARAKETAHTALAKSTAVPDRPRTKSTASSGKSSRPSRVAKAAPRAPAGTFVAPRDIETTGALPGPSFAQGRFPDAAPPYRRIRSVGEALDAGLTVTRVRTFQLPDGRRIQVESEPDPRMSLDLLVRPPPY